MAQGGAFLQVLGRWCWEWGADAEANFGSLVIQSRVEGVFSIQE